MIKQSWPETITSKEIGQHLVDHFTQQGCCSIQGGSCRYRLQRFNQPTLACAAGALLSDDEAALCFEGVAFNHSSASLGHVKVPARLWPHLDLISRVQNIHDATAWVRASDPDAFGRMLAKYRHLAETGTLPA